MVTYKKAKPGYKFVLTEFGFENTRIRVKLENPSGTLYIYTVPQAWIDKGYVEEVKIDG